MSRLLSFEPAEDAVVVDIDRIITNKLLVQASSGGGKSYMLRYVLESTHGRVQQIILDHDGEFGTLREKFDYLLVGKDGDVPTDPKTAKLLARRLMELHASAVIDLYDLTLADRKEFVKRFLDELMHLPRTLWHPLMVVIDEAHVYCPEKGHGEAVSSAAVIDLATNGRKRGYALCAATQRLSKFNKDAAADLLNKLIGMTGLDVDVKRAGDDLGFGKEQRESLKQLDPGQFYAYGPAISRTVTLVHTGAIQTTHPQPGQIAPPKPPAPEKVQKLVGGLGDLATKAAEEVRDFQTAQKKIQTLEAELRKARRPQEPGIVHESEVQKRIDTATAPLLNKIGELEGTFKEAAAVTRMIVDAHEHLFSFEQRLGSILHLEGYVAEKAIKTAEIDRAGEALLSKPPVERPTQSEGVTNPQQRILNTLATFEVIGLADMDRAHCAIFADASPNSGAYANNLGRLRTLGYIDYPSKGRVQLTDSGRGVADADPTPLSVEDFRDRWFALLKSNPQVAILRRLIEAYPNSVERTQLAEDSGASATSGAYANNLGRLRSLGLVDYPSKGFVVATSFLFPEGL